MPANIRLIESVDGCVIAIPINMGAGVVEIGVAAEIITGKLTAELVIPSRDAVILACPAASPVTKPETSIYAMLLLSLFQVTCGVMFVTALSEYVP